MSAQFAGSPNREAFTKRMEVALIARIGAQRYHMWFPLVTFVPMGQQLMVIVPNAHAQDWIAHAFGDAIHSSAMEVLETNLTVTFVVEEVIAPKADVEKKTKAQLNLFEEPRPLPPKPEAKPKKATRRFKTLADFVVGPSNRVVHASAWSIVEEPAQGANPLVIHGPTGTGKTHLLEGIYGGLRKTQSDFTPTYVTAEEFTTRFVQSSRFNKQGQFRRQFRDCGALLLDDLHFLGTKKLTQEEFLHTFDALMAEGRQVVVTMDCHPRHADELMPELVDRLLGGAVWGLLPPDDETRLAILRKKAGQAQPLIPEDVLQFLARSLRGNVRELEGAVNSVRHYSRVVAKPVTVSLTREALGDLLRHSIRVVTVSEVDQAVCKVLHLPIGTLQSKSRTWSVSHPRSLAIYLSRKHTSATYGDIAKHFNVKTHSTPVAAEKKVREWIHTNAKLVLGEREWKTRDLVDRLERELQR